MVFTVFTPGTKAKASEVNANFIENPYRAPIGSIVAWLKSYPNTPALPYGWVECNGQILNDTDSVYNGQTIPNLNGYGGTTQRFLRGSTTSGATGGSDIITTSSYCQSASLHCDYVADNGHYHLNFDPKPPFYEVVWIMRVK